MSEPEIARRCLNCGASVRGRASFCPQCGNRMDGAEAAAAVVENHAAASVQTNDEPRTPARSALVEEAARVAVNLNEKLPPSEESPAAGVRESAPEGERVTQAREEMILDIPEFTQSFEREESVAEFATESAESAADTATASRPAREAGTRGGRIGRRAATVGASVGENLRPRVEKLREVSTVVLDEATDDPGLRFVIVAAVLFLVFLFIFLFSYILG